MPTATTRIFKSGDSFAVQIPKDMTPLGISDEAQIEWNDVEWTIRPLYKRSLAGLMDACKAFSPDFMAEGREFHEQKERDWSGFDTLSQDAASAATASQLPQPPPDYGPRPDRTTDR